jgi:hypothetical protein
MPNTTDLMPGSKASSPQEPPRNSIDFQFLNFSHPSDAKASRARKTVRSHVTRQQHQREHAAQAARRAQSYPEAASETDQPVPLRHHAQTFPSQRPTTLELPASNAAGAPTTSSPEASSSPSPQASPTSAEHTVDVSELYPTEWVPYIRPILVSRVRGHCYVVAQANVFLRITTAPIWLSTFLTWTLL